MKRIENKTAIITGGAGGIGKATAKLFSDEGAKVLLIDIDKEQLEKAVKETGNGNVDYFVADVSKEEDVKKYVKHAEEKFGKVDIFFNNAGIEGTVGPVTDYPTETFEKLIDVNVKGTWLGMKHVLPVMNDNGSVVMTSSVAGMEGTPNVSPYVASKHAVIGIMRSTALEAAPRKIRVNTINPSPVDNQMMRSLEESFDPENQNQVKQSFEDAIPMKRYAESEEIANVALFLSGPESSFITGAVIPVDGGMTA